MDVFVWHWGVSGAKPRLAYELAQALKTEAGVTARLSLSESADLFRNRIVAASVDLPAHTASSATGLGLRTAVDQRLRAIGEALGKSRPDIAIGIASGVADRAVMRGLRAHGVPVVLIMDRNPDPSEGRVGLRAFVHRRLAQRATGLVALSRFVAGEIRTRREFAGKPLLAMPYPAFSLTDLDLAEPEPVAPLKGRKLRILLPGRLKADKDLDLMAQALALLGDARYELRVAGKPEAGAEAGLRGMPQAALHLGWQSEAELIAHIDWSDIVALPFASATQSGLIPLSNARARPVIATPVGGVPEQIEQDVTGIVTLGVTPRALADGLGGLIEDPARIPAMSRAALARAREETGWAQIVPPLTGFMRDLIVRDPKF
jgi:glycosyltransferase involved in cell wall biosynthesis